MNGYSPVGVAPVVEMPRDIGRMGTEKHAALLRAWGPELRV